MVDIMGKKNILYAISGALFVAGVLALVIFGLKPGIDFTGGSLIELNFRQARPAAPDVQRLLSPLNLGTVVVQTAGEDGLLLRTRFITEQEHQRVLQVFRGDSPSGTIVAAPLTTSTAIAGSAVRSVGKAEIEISTGTPRVIEKRFETIGGTVSKQLRQRALTASIIIILVIVAFVAYAFRKVSRPVESWKYGVAAVLAMIHDVTITAGVFAVLGKYLGVEIDIAFLVAMLTVFGYSVNDTIVVFDRIRENLIRHSAENFTATVNAAVNQTMARSVNTSLTTLIVLVVLFFVGGETIHYFALALIIGIFLGTYSSIFVASSLLVSSEEWRRRNRE
ncbi:MAG: protein translocase subunit SecF [Candidatus Magasanikbacteria bacterium]|nr:protein translocase subunit SecF [Candidatus Magasanikbacteria bacterium]